MFKISFLCFLILSSIALISYAQPVGECPEEDPPEQPPTILPDDENCGSYYVCNSGDAIQLFCPQATYWNIAESACVKGATKAKCGDRPTTPSPGAFF